MKGPLSLGDMTLYLVAFRQGQQSFHSILTAVGGMYEDTLYMSNLFEFLAIPVGSGNGARAAGNGAPATVLAPGEAGIRFEGVGFRYPGAPACAP